MIRETLLCAAVLLGAAATLWVITALIGMALYQPDCEERTYIVIPVKGHREDIEFVIRGVVASRQRGAVILVADFGADKETAAIAGHLCNEYERMEWVRGEAIAHCLHQYVNGGQHNKEEG